ncbi:MAG: squalene--hopene cyclase [Candidatus Methylomirabilales bacterium]
MREDHDPQAPGLRSEEVGPGVQAGPDRLDQAITRARSYLLSIQAPEGYWVGELEADTTITSEYVFLRRFLGLADPRREAKAARYLRERQCGDGGWNLYPGGKSDISATVKAYFALKMIGVPVDDPALIHAREFVHAAGGITKVNVFTKITLALFGQYDWRGVPAMPAEIMLLPAWSPFNLCEVSYWSRTVIVPLIILLDRKPVWPVPSETTLDELYLVPRAQADLSFPHTQHWISWKNFFIRLDQAIRALERHGPRPLRGEALRKAEEWILARMGPGGLGGIFPAMANAVMALQTLGYPLDHPKLAEGLQEIENLVIEEPDRLHVQPCLSPIWDTALAVNALLESGLPPAHPALEGAAAWLLSKQITVPGDWQVKRPALKPGGWAFQFFNEFYPDTDDTAMVLMALYRLGRGKRPEWDEALTRGLEWFIGMQFKDGGWGSFDADSSKLVFNHIPFADHGALLDPSTEDLAGRGLELLGLFGRGLWDPVVRQALAFLWKTQQPDGSWYGRWGVNYIYGTWSVLRGLRAIGYDMRAEQVRRAVEWLVGRQNPDGGWGEECGTYEDRERAGRGGSTPSHTAWALLGLLAAGESSHPAVEHGIQFLLERQEPNGSWEDPWWNGTGFPRVFYLKYHLYATYFPLWALGVYRASR